jgi:electron-transferring-flavoprotein dehydrogenase
MVVGLDYQNTYLSPYKEFQRWKHHPDIAKHLKGGECISYGARCLNEGGYNAIPKLTFPGGAIIGCAAGFLNSVKIKGSHTAMKSGMLAAEAIYDLLQQDGASTAEAGTLEPIAYEDALYKSWVAEELHIFRNSHAAFHWGLLPGMVHTAFAAFISKGNEPWTLANKQTDASKTKPAKECTPITYPKPDGVLSFDLLTNLQRSGI